MNIIELFPMEESMAYFLISLFVKGSLVLLTAGVLSFCFRRVSAAWRHLAWVGAAAALLLLPVASSVVPSFTLLTFSSAPTPAGSGTERAAPPVYPKTNNIHDVTNSAAWTSTTSTVKTETTPDNLPGSGGTVGDIAEPPSIVDAQTAPSPKHTPFSMGGVLLTVWLIGAFLTVVPMVLGNARLRSLVRNAARVDSADWQSWLKECRQAMGVRAEVLLLRGPEKMMPMTCGIFRPAIFLPAEAGTWLESRCKAVLLHELAHIKRSDCLTHLISRLACAVHWFNPLAWWANRQMLGEREKACDDLVLMAGTTKPSDYAGHLLAVASKHHQNWLLGGAAIAVARKSALEGRLLAVLSGSRKRSTLTRGSVIAVFVAACASAAVTGAVTIAPVPAETKPGMENDFGPLVERVSPADGAGSDFVFALGSDWQEIDTRLASTKGEPSAAVAQTEEPANSDWAWGASNGSGTTALITGFDSDNLVSVDLTTGEWSEVYKFVANARPRGVALGNDGTVFVAFRGATGNIVRLTPESSGDFLFHSLTRPIGQNGPGRIVLDNRGLWVAGDSERRVLLFDENTGDELSSIPGRPYNVLGLLVTEDYVYTAEYLQRSITRYKLNAATPETTVLVSASDELDRPLGLALGHTGNLFVVNEAKPTVAEFDKQTGEFIRTLADLGGEGVTGLRGLAFDPITMRYYVTERSRVHILDREGRRLQSYTIPVLERAEAIALIPSEKPPIRRLVIDHSSLKIEGVAGERYELEASTDLINWEPIAILENLNGDVEFVDSDASQFDRRFYRVRNIE